MENFNIIPNAGTYGSAIALINANFQLTKEQLERLAYSREGFCGMYETDDNLEAAYPHPTTGSFAYVGTSFPMTVYLATNGVWAASSSTYSGGGIDLTQYALDADLESLADRVAALESAGYVFIGVATPNGVPTVTTKSFALAWAAGTYTNYGGYVVNAGELAVLLYNGSAWSGIKTDIVAKGVVGGYDTTPTEDSEKPVTSGGVYEALDDLRDDVEEMLANADAEFGTGEKVSDTLIRLALGSRDDVLLTQKTVSNAIFNEINISDIGDLNTLAYQLAPSDSRSLKPTFYTVIATRGALTYRVGSMAVFSDNLGHVVTEVMTTHYLLDASGNLTSTSSDSELFSIYRSVNPSVGTWTTWHYVNSSIWTSAINSVRTDLTNYYTKLQTYSKTEVDNLIAGINQFEYIVANSLPYPSANTMRKIYLIPSAHSVTQNVKDEYITIWDNNLNLYKWEQIGSTAVDLSGYSTTAEMNTAINAAIASALISYYTKTEVNTLLDGKQDAIDDLATIRSGAAAGATAVQPAAIADFATTDYVGEAIEDAIDAIPVDEEPTPGSENLVTSRGIYKKEEETRNTVEGFIPMVPIATVDGKVINNDGEEHINANFAYQKYIVEPKHLYYVSAKFRGNNIHVWTVSYFDEDFNYISGSHALEFTLDSEHTEVSIHHAATSSPSTAAYMYVNVQKILSDATFVNDVPAVLPEINTMLIQKAFGADVMEVYNNKYYQRSGGVNPTSLSYLVMCSVTPDSTYKFKISIPANCLANYKILSYLDSDRQLISGSPSYQVDPVEPLSIDTEITTPSSCRYVYINVPKSAINDLVFMYKDLSEPEEAGELEPLYDVCTPYEEVDGYFISTPAQGETAPQERQNANACYWKYTLDTSKKYVLDYFLPATFNATVVYFVDENGDYISSQIKNNTGAKMKGITPLAIPSNAAEAYINGTIFGTSWTVLKEVSTVDRTSEILNKLNLNGICKLKSGDYYINSLVMPDGTVLQGEGKRTRLIMSGSSDGYAIRVGARCTIQDLWIDGNENLVYKGEDNIEIQSILMHGNRHGILLLGNGIGDAYREKWAGTIISRCEITNFRGGGITCDNTGYTPYSSLTVSDTWIRNCCVGINIAYLSEFNKFTNVGCYYCRYGCINNGGNNLFSNINLGSNTLGFYMNGDDGKCIRYNGTTVKGVNMGHGSMTNANLVHAGKSNASPGYAVVIINIDPGFVISGVDGGYGKYYIERSRSIILNNLRLGDETGFEFINNDWPITISNALGLPPASSDPNAKLSFVPFVIEPMPTSWDSDGNGGRVYMYGCFGATVKVSPQSLSALG